MAKFWRRKAQQDTRNAQPAHNARPAPGPADLAAWAREVDVSRLSSQTVREAEDYLDKYRHMNLELSQQMGWRVMAAVEAQVTPSPPPFAQPLDVIATVLAVRRKQPGTGLSSPSALVLPSLGYEASGSGLRASQSVTVVPPDLGERLGGGRLRRPSSLTSQPCSPRLVYRLVTGCGFQCGSGDQVLGHRFGDQARNIDGLTDDPALPAFIE